MKKNYRIMGKIVFALYILFLLYFLILSRNSTFDEMHYNFVPFHEILRYWNYRDQLGMLTFTNLLGNIAIFIPLGFLEALVVDKRSFLKTSLDGFLLSLLVEICQMITRVGTFDVDDLILNTLGTMLGYLVFLTINAIGRIYDKHKKKA